MGILLPSIGAALTVVIGFFVAQWLPLKWSRIAESPIIYVVYGAIYLMFAASVCFAAAMGYALFMHSIDAQLSMFEEYVRGNVGWVYFAALVTSIAGGFALNKVIYGHRQLCVWLADRMTHNKLDQMFIAAFKETKPVCLVLGDGKVHVGWAYRMPLPTDDREYVSIVPFKGGYADDAHQIIFNVNYYRVRGAESDFAVEYIDSPMSIARSSIKTAYLYAPEAGD